MISPMRRLIHRLSLFTTFLMTPLIVGLLLIGRLLPNNGQIAFTLRQGESAFLYLLDVGSGVRARLMRLEKSDESFAWSPDGSQIAISAEQDGNSEIVLLTVNCPSLLAVCLGPRNLTQHPADDLTPVWTPDGQAIIFTSERDRNREIYGMNADGTQLVNLSHNPGYDSLPTLSPDGSQLAFHSDRAGFLRIYLMDADGSNPHALLNNFTRAPIWSPNGSQVAYLFSGDVYIVDAHCETLAGGCRENAQNLTRTPEYRDWFPVWSPDGERLLFHSDRAVRPVVYLMEMNCTTCARRLTDELQFSLLPDWSPEGNSIALLSNDSGQIELYVMNGQGTQVRCLTHNLGQIYSVRWRPV